MAPDVSNVFLWLSAASDEQNQSKSQIDAMEELIRRLAREIYSQGGTIVHGMHPVITKWLVEELQTIPEDRRKNALQLVVSQFFQSSFADEYSKTVSVIRTPASEHDRDASLWEMRHDLSMRCNAFLAIGGKLHLEAKGRAGITVEIDVAKNAGLPCYILGGFGGDACHYAENNRLDNLKNGLSSSENAELIMCSDVEKVLLLLKDGLSRLPLETSARNLRSRQRACSGRFRILSLNGGGIKGAFSAAVITAIENEYNCSIAKYFDLIAGTSTGGLIALGLGAGVKADRILRLYKEKGAVIFPKGCALWRMVKWVMSRKYGDSGLRAALSEMVSAGNGGKRLGDSCCRLLIPSFSADNGKMQYFTTPHAEFCNSDRDVNMIDIALATSAAPTYFPPAKVVHACSVGRYLDGGVGANMPALMAVLHAIHYLGVDRSQIDVLSIGTTTRSKGYLSIPKGLKSWFLTGKIVDLYSNAQESFMQDGLEMLLRPEQFLHIDSIANDGDFSIDELDNVDQLIARGEASIREEKISAVLKSRFINGVSAANWRTISQ